MKKFEIEHYNTVRNLSSECIVLLKSDGSFPIDVNEKISLYGNGARHTLRGGTGGGIVEVRSFTTVEQGLKNAGFAVVSDEWLNAYDAICEKAKAEHKNSVKSALATDGLTALGALSVAMSEPDYDLPFTGKSEVAIYVLTRVSGEGADRAEKEGDIYLTKTEIRDIFALSKQYKKFMLVLNVSGVVDLSPVVDMVNNIMLLSQLGSATGDAFADVLCGKTYPSGKLASTWAKYSDYCKEGDINPPDDTKYREGIYVGYRYFDSADVQPLFPFGFGLSYTTFQAEVFKPTLKGTVITIPVAVKNIGTHTGKEVVQVYVSVPCGKLNQPYQVLAAFQKTKELKAEQSQILNISFDIREIASFDGESCCRILESGDYVIRVGNSSRNTEAAAIVRLDKTAVVERVTHVGGNPDFEDYKPERKAASVSADLPILELKADDVSEVKHTKPQIDERAVAFVKSLSDEELCYLCTGNFDEETSAALDSEYVPGAAGQSTLKYKQKGIHSLIMADGPAGLHISGQYGIDDNGKYPVVNQETKEIKAMLPPEILKYLLVIFPDAANENRGGEICDQYCTALPIETALAQSFNPDLCFICGDIVGSEMEEYGVDFHLAPALNTHRHTLCGRNFEYFSEDPYLSGKLAVGIIKGVQSHKGKGSMPKHFVCNEQDTNRLNSNSILSERALRDIYMRPFEIAVKEGKPLAIMTSYNLVNGVHTSERSDLINTVLRDEWGFDGIVVSDWVGYKKSPDGDMKYPRARAHKTVATGNDLMMPGSKGHYDELLENLHNPESPLTREILEVCAARMVAMAWKIKGAE